MGEFSLLELVDGPLAKNLLNWWNVFYSFAFLLVPIILSIIFRLGISLDLLISGARCVLQLTVLGSVLNQVLTTNHPGYVFAMTTLLVLLASLELVFSKTKRQFTSMLPFVFLSLVVSILVVASCGQMFALRKVPFWEPTNFIPTSGMLIGNAMSAIAVGINFCLKELTENSLTIETHLSMGASRTEAFMPILSQALKVSLLPTINAMSIAGLISIPGMMTGQILGGTSIADAVKYQSIILFMITSSTSLSVLFSCLFLFTVCLDSKHRLRPDKIYERTPWSLSQCFGVFSRSPAKSGPPTGHRPPLSPTPTTPLLANSRPQ